MQTLLSCNVCSTFSQEKTPNSSRHMESPQVAGSRSLSPSPATLPGQAILLELSSSRKAASSTEESESRTPDGPLWTLTQQHTNSPRGPSSQSLQFSFQPFLAVPQEVHVNHPFPLHLIRPPFPPSHKARTHVQHAWNSAKGAGTCTDASACPAADTTYLLNSY